MLLRLLTFLFLALTSHAAPLHILYLGHDTASADRCHFLMQELGREAIWFDYATTLSPDWVNRFDAILLDAPGEAPNKPTITPGDPKAVRDQILAKLPMARIQAWQSFLTNRQTETREPHPSIANYEKRPVPVTLQAPFNVQGSSERTHLAPDLRLELFASEPDITKPIAMAWDARGRCWIAETSDYPHGISPSGEGSDRIKICEDTDGDGRADKFTVFADKLNIPTSLVFSRGGLIVAQPPRLLWLQDTDGDDKADVRQDMMTGWGIRDTHAQASSLHYGYDNWIQGCVGYSGFKGLIGGRQMEFSMGTYRFKPDGSKLEFLHQFSNNSWGHSQNAAGDQFGGTANGAPIMYGGIPATVTQPGLRTMTAKRINVEKKAHAITPNYRQVDVFGGYTSAAGSAFIASDSLPPRLQGKAMICEPTMKIIALEDVEPEGAGYVAKDGWNLLASTDEWMSPVFAEVGPDGAVWFADWQNFIIQHNPTPSVEQAGYEAKTGVGGAHENPLRDHARGRIYRVVWDQKPKPPIQSLHAATTAQLVTALGSDLQERRLTAQRLLVEGQKTDAASELKRLVAAKPASLAAVHALWTLHGLNALDPATHQTALLSPDPILRRNAVRALGTTQEAASMLFGSGVISDPDPHTRLATLVKLAEVPTTPDIQTFVRNLVADPAVKADEWLSEAARLLTRKHQAVDYREGPNLLPNPGFETTGADSLPEGWQRRDYGGKPASAAAEWKAVTTAGASHGGTTAVQCITRGEGDTSLFAEVPLQPNTEYRLSGWVRTHAFRGRAGLNDHIGRHETGKVTERESKWTEIDVRFRNGDRSTASINLLHVGTGDTLYDDVRLSSLIPDTAVDKILTGDPSRGRQIFSTHATAACTLCHMVGGVGSAVGPPLDGLASRKDARYIEESLLEPNKVLAEGFQALGVSPMPPMNLVLKPQEIEDVKAYLGTLK